VVKILLIEDDAEAVRYIVATLGQVGHHVDHAATGRDGLALAAPRAHDLLIIDRMLPDIDGLAVARRLRVEGDDRPILFLTTLGGVADRVEGLDAGGDDYLIKPFAFSELVARLGALMRRATGKTIITHLNVADLELDRLRRTVVRAGRTIDLQPNEYRLLEYLMLNAGQPVTKTMLLENVWGFHFEPGTSIVEIQISRLRSKIDRGFDKPLIETIRGGGGYCLRDPS
jgi:two-component system OmpR family response regulator